MSEQNLRKCKMCGELKLRILAGKFESNNKKWVNEENKQWVGSVCPTCNKQRSQNNMRRLRLK